MDHAVLSPSAAHRWAICPSSIFRTVGYPETTSEFAEEGTRAHALAEKTLRLNHGSYPICDDKEMEKYITEYVKTIRKMTKHAQVVWYECKLDLSQILGVPNSFGTGDVVALIGDELQVHDLKYGKGVPVDAVENLQLVLYALGAVRLMELVGEIKKIRMCIHQIRLDHYSEWVVDLSTLNEMGSFLNERAQLALSITKDNADDFYYPGEKQCKWCLAKGECEALAEHVRENISEDFENLEAVAGYDPEYFASVLPNLDLIEDWCSAVRKAAQDRLIKGAAIPGWKLVMGRGGKRQWKDEEEVVKVFKSMKLKMNEMYKSSLITPSAAEKLLKGKRWERLEPLVTKGEGSPTIAPVSDSRVEWKPVSADDFDDLTK